MKQIKKVGVLQTAKVTAMLYLVLSAIFCIPFSLISLITGRTAGIMAIFLPLLYAAMGFIVIAATCFLYNFIASKIGGIEIDIEQE